MFTDIIEETERMFSRIIGLMRMKQKRIIGPQEEMSILTGQIGTRTYNDYNNYGYMRQHGMSGTANINYQ